MDWIRAQVQQKTLTLQLGHSHPITMRLLKDLNLN